MIYILSISLQLSAGIILLIWSLKNFHENVLDLYFPGSNVVTRDENNNVTLDKQRLRDKANIITLSLFSFLDLSVGFLLSIIGSKIYENIINITLVIILSLAIIVIERILSCGFSALIYSKNIIVPYSILEARGVGTFITSAEVDEMLNNDSLDLDVKNL